MKVGYSLRVKVGYSLRVKVGYSLRVKVGYSLRVKVGYSLRVKVGYSLGVKVGYSLRVQRTKSMLIVSVPTSAPNVAASSFSLLITKKTTTAEGRDNATFYYRSFNSLIFNPVTINN